MEITWQPGSLRRGNQQLGVLSDGSPDFLGCWYESEPGVSPWQAIADDLRARGVERLRFAVGSDPAGMEAAFRAAYPSCTALPADDLALGGAVHTPVKGYSQAFESLNQTVGGLSKALRRAVLRRFPLAGPPGADLLRNVAERFLGTDGRCREPVRRQVNAKGNSPARAAGA